MFSEWEQREVDQRKCFHIITVNINISIVNIVVIIIANINISIIIIINNISEWWRESEVDQRKMFSSPSGCDRGGSLLTSYFFSRNVLKVLRHQRRCKIKC